MSAATAPSALASTSVSSGSSWDSASALTTKERLSHFEQHNPEVENKTGIHSTEKIVVGIYVVKEQSWFDEKKKLRKQIGLMNELRVVEKHKDKLIAELNSKLEESKVVVQSKDNKGKCVKILKKG
ncbi:hypothetical protein BC332_33990 [Capsicum chinense]|nr:hypothetical protein BC332_33990 [Capsicum chinense]